MAYMDFSSLKQEFVVFLRNQDVLTTTQRGVTTNSSDTFSGDNSTTAFLINRPNVKNIRSISVDAVVQTRYVDYTVDYSYDDSGTIKCRIVFTSAPASGTNNITLSYDYGTDRIFSDYPKNDLKIINYPRIAVDILSANSQEVALGGGVVQTDVSISVTAYSASQAEIENMLDSIRAAVLANKKNFYNIRFITPVGVGPMIPSMGTNDKIVSRTIDFMAPLNIEE